MEVVIRALSRETQADYFAFFDTVAFSDNADWSSCYCCFYHHDPKLASWETRTGAQNRDTAGRLIAEGTLRGWLAYADGKPIGWCNASDKKAYALLSSEPDLWEDNEPSICAIVCFIVAPAARSQGVARQLLGAACSHAAAAGFDIMEAYPRKKAETCAANYHGPASLYRSAGFSVHREMETAWIVRRNLKAGPTAAGSGAA